MNWGQAEGELEKLDEEGKMDDMTGWIILGSAIVYLLGILGAVQVLALDDDSLHENFVAFLRFSLGATLWPIIMPVAGLAWLFGTRYWVVKQRDD